MLTTQNDIITQFKSGDDRAFQCIFHMYFKGLCQYSEYITCDKTEAEDIAIESIWKLFEQKHRLRINSLPAVRTFLLVCVRNASFNFLRDQRRRERLHKEFIYLHHTNQYPVYNEAVIIRVLKEVYAQVEQLPPQCREIFKLVFLKSWSTRQVAEALGISQQTVLNQKSKAIHLIRSALLDQELGPHLWFSYPSTALPEEVN